MATRTISNDRPDDRRWKTPVSGVIPVHAGATPAHRTRTIVEPHLVMILLWMALAAAIFWVVALTSMHPTNMDVLNHVCVVSSLTALS